MLVYQRVNLHFPMVFLWFSYGFMVLLRFCYPIPMTWQVVPWWPSPGACEPGQGTLLGATFSKCQLNKCLLYLLLYLIYIVFVYPIHTHMYIYKYTLYIHTLYIYTLYKYMHTYIYLLNTHTHIYIYNIYTTDLSKNPHVCYSPSVLTQDSQMVDHFTPTNYSRWNRGGIWLVGGWPTPLKNDGVRQLGWWHSQDMEKCSKPPTKWLYIWIVFPQESRKKEGVLLGCVPASCSCFLLNSCVWCLRYA